MSLLIFSLLKCSLSYGKIVKGERRDKKKNNVFMIGYAEPQPILSKDSAN